MPENNNKKEPAQTSDKTFDGIILSADGERKEWYCDGKLHRENGPAVEYKDGSKNWYIHGLLHRENGPAVIRYFSSQPSFKDKNNIDRHFYDEVYYQNGALHRENGPAMIYRTSDGYVEYEDWRRKGLLHREDGPAGIKYEVCEKTGDLVVVNEVYYLDGETGEDVKQEVLKNICVKERDHLLKNVGIDLGIDLNNDHPSSKVRKI